MHPVLPIIIIIGIIVGLTQERDQPSDRVVLLPGADGTTGAVIIRTPAGETVLDRPYAAASIDPKGAVGVSNEDAQAVRERFAAALDALPSRPVSFTVHFITGTDELTAESQPQFDAIKAELAQRPAPEIIVIGHTDRVGSLVFNDALSLKRAEAVRGALVAAGVARERIEIAGRGEREPVVPTADEVPEPRNRRVEISVR